METSLDSRRFFGLDGPGKGFINPPPGSVLDHTVMKKNFDDFLLVSQHVTQVGVTSRLEEALSIDYFYFITTK